MIVLPIVARELRRAARRASTYRTRFLTGLVVMALWLILLLGSNGVPPARMGQHVFTALGVLALGFAMLAGVFLTSDCLSEEKREGTLGLLFLTDLSGGDVVLGKLAAASVHAMFALLASFPILGLPLIMGGVSGAEFWRLVLVLAATLFLSLAMGIFVSSVCYEAKHSIGASSLFMLLIAGLFPALWWLQSILVKVRFLDILLWPSPGFAYLKAFDSMYRLRAGPADFWRSLGTICGLGLLCLLTAHCVLPRVWQQTESSASKVFWLTRTVRWIFHTRTRRIGRQLLSMEGNPYQWLTARQGSAASSIRALLGIFIPIWAIALAASIFSSKHEDAFITCFAIAFGLHFGLKILIASEATRRVSEDRASGALESILVTPLPVNLILTGHRIALRQFFRGPIFILCLLNLVMACAVLAFPKRLDMDGEAQVGFCEVFTGGVIMLALDSYALGWVGMWTGLNSTRHHRAVLAVMAKVMGPPWLALFLLIFLQPNLSSRAAFVVFGGWFCLGGVIDLVAGGRARKKLKREFRTAALQRFEARPDHPA